jgi:hypothetical protein
VAIINALPELEITLLTSDFRIAQVAHTFGIKRAVGVDVVRNIPQIANGGDILIFDSAEANPGMLKDMQVYFSTFIRVNDDPEDQVYPGEFLINPYIKHERSCNALPIDLIFLKEQKKSYEKTFFFGDDDYEEDLVSYLPSLKDKKMKLLLGFYFFIDYEDKLKEDFSELIEPEEYQDVVMQSSHLVTSSPMAVLQGLASNSNPVYIQRGDYTQDFLPLFKELNIPCFDYKNMTEFDNFLKEKTPHKYEKLSSNVTNIADFITNCLN